MKLLRYGPVGQERPGILDRDGKIRDLTDVVGDIAGETLTARGLAKIQSQRLESLPLVHAQTRIGPCIGSVGKFICIGLNYADHAAETGAPIPAEPIVFMKATSAICGPNDDVIQPLGSTKLDWEVELGIVIGTAARYISEADAPNHIVGYCVINDVSERHFQLERGGQWDKGKGCDTFGPIGPWLVTPDEIGNVEELPLWLDVNGRRFQDGSTRTMIFKPHFLVSYLSHFMSLQPGDVISTGTPPGVGLGQKPPLYLKPGDVMELEIAGLGRQRQMVREYRA
jgi:2-keto-4-pentenoate hydratase/2-oxohepta-3-ene-1,7-dioic acid hydratase in catechol pathway